MFQFGGNIFTSLYQKIHESPEILADFTQIYNNKQDSEGKKKLKTKMSEEHSKQTANMESIAKNYYDGLMSEIQNETLDEDFLAHGLNSYYKVNGNHEKQKSLSKLFADNSGSKNINLSPRTKQMLSINKVIKNSTS